MEMIIFTVYFLSRNLYIQTNLKARPYSWKTYFFIEENSSAYVLVSSGQLGSSEFSDFP
jgi:hypothetical protein